MNLFEKQAGEFADRHIGPNEDEAKKMLKEIGTGSIEELINRTIPPAILIKDDGDEIAPMSEFEYLTSLKKIAEKNKIHKSYIGQGYYDTMVPAAILRNLFENPGWHTQYTPYQAEIAQGRLESLLNFQTIVSDLTALPIANASLLDEGTAAAEAMHLCHAVKGSDTKNAFFVSELCHPQTIAVVQTRALPLGIEIVVGSHETQSDWSKFFGALFQYPATRGEVLDYRKTIESVRAGDCLAVVATDLLALTLLTPPGEFGADIALGNAQRFGVPLGFGGPHAAFFATKDEFKRQMPGRLVGVSRDANGLPGYRLSLQTREQHIRREKATSNICTAQALLANMAAMYAVYHGAEGLKRIAQYVHTLTLVLAGALRKLGYEVQDAVVFDTIVVRVKSAAKEVITRAESQSINLRLLDDRSIGISLDEAASLDEVQKVLTAIHGSHAAA